jgi:hypothetical protein
MRGVRYPFDNPDAPTPTPTLVAAWLALNTLPTELVPMWTAHWLVDGLDGPALRSLAGQSGSDPYAVRDLLPEALVEAGARIPAVNVATATVAYDHFARMCLDGLASEHWVSQKVEELFVNSGYDNDLLSPPLGAVYGLDDEWEGGWGRTPEALAIAIRAACAAQLGRA